MVTDGKEIMENGKHVGIVGAGIAGLSAGIHLRKAGIEATIFESHTLPGGQCTSWDRKGFTFDGCAHWVVGTGEGKEFYSLWKELGALEGTRILDHDRYMEVTIPGGRSLIFYTDLDRTEQELLRAASSPADRVEIQRFIKAARIAAKVELPDPGERSLSALWLLLKNAPRLIRLWKWTRVTAGEFASRFQDPLLKKAFESVFVPGFSILFFLFTLAWLQNRNAGYPMGGSLAFARKIEKRFLELGGKIHYNRPVEKILVENGRATGLRLKGGNEHRFDAIISAADGHATIDEMLEGRFHNPKLKKAWEVIPPFDPLFYISLGLRGKLQLEPSVSGHAIQFALPVSTSFGPVDGVLVHSMDFDPSLAPEGKSVVVLMVETSWDAWKDEDRKSERYRQRKEKDSRAILEAIEKEYYPGLSGMVEEMDVATPLTWVRYTGVFHGAFEGLQMTPEVFRLGMSLPKTLDGLSRFSLCGQWVEPGGGLPTAAQSGKMAAALISGELS